MTTFYLGGAWPLKDEIEAVAQKLELLSPEYDINSSWHRSREVGTPEEFSAKDVNEVSESDVFVMFNTVESRKASLGGMHTELGVALEAGCEVFIIGDQYTEMGCGVNNFTALADECFSNADVFLSFMAFPETIKEFTQHGTASFVN